MILFSRRFSLKEFSKHVRKVVLLYNDIEYVYKERIELIKRENKKGKGVLLMMNHFNALDPYFIYDFVEFYSVAKSDLIGETDGYWLLEYVKDELYERCQLISYKRGDKKSGQEVKDAILNMINKGKNVIVFPEGTCQHCFLKPLPFKKGIIELAFEHNIPIFSMSINYSKDIGASREEPVDFVDIFEKSPDVRIYMNGMFYPKTFTNWESLNKEVYRSIADNVEMEWKKI